MDSGCENRFVTWKSMWQGYLNAAFIVGALFTYIIDISLGKNFYGPLIYSPFENKILLKNLFMVLLILSK